MGRSGFPETRGFPFCSSAAGLAQIAWNKLGDAKASGRQPPGLFYNTEKAELGEEFATVIKLGLITIFGLQGTI